MEPPGSNSFSAQPPPEGVLICEGVGAFIFSRIARALFQEFKFHDVDG
jgi:hypothetical protein